MRTIDAKVVAAITSAIVAVTGIPAVNLKFTAIKRLNSGALPWAQASNMKIINTQQIFTEGGIR